MLETYADIAAASCADSLIAAQCLKAAVDTLIDSPSAEALEDAKPAWLASSVPYQQTEVYQFGNAIVDDWEGEVNSWPLDEGLIDYVDNPYGGPTDEIEAAVLNVIAITSFTLSSEVIEAIEITPAVLEESLHQAGGAGANVAMGYHAIEFLLWGQDLNGHLLWAGNRPWTDYAAGDACTGGNCDRWAEYLSAAAEPSVSDLECMAAQWGDEGSARAKLLANESAGIIAILTCMGSLSYGEQAGERMRLGLMLNDPEQEHDCFSDNTHNSHYYDGLGIQIVYLGEYVRVDGSPVSGASLSHLVPKTDAELDVELRGELATIMMALGRIKTAAEAGFSNDMMLERGYAAGEALVIGGVKCLIDQTASIERAVASLGVDPIAFEGSDSLDNAEAVFEKAPVPGPPS